MTNPQPTTPTQFGVLDAPIINRDVNSLPTGVSDPVSRTAISVGLFSFQSPILGSVARSANAKMADLYDVKDAGVMADGVTDDTVALQNAITAANAAGQTLISTTGTILISSTVTFPPTVNIDFTGSTILSNGVTSGNAVVFNGPQPSGSIAGVIRGLTVLQPLTSGHANPAINADGVSLQSCNGVTFHNLDIQGFRDNLRADGANCYLNKFCNSAIGNSWRRNFAVYASSNSNESHLFEGGVLFNCNNTSFNGAGVYVDPAASATEVKLFGVSLDYNDISVNATNCRISLIDCHLENNNGNPHVQLTFTAGGERPTLVQIAGSMAGGPGITSWTGIPVEGANGRPAFITTTSGNANIVLRGTKCGGSYTTVPYQTELVHSTDGIANRRLDLSPVIDATSAVGSALPLTICYATSSTYKAANGSASGWTTSVGSGNTLTASTSIFQPPDTGSRQIVTGSTNNGSLLQTYQVNANQSILAKTFVQASGMGPSATACIRVQFFAQDGTTLISDTQEPRQITANTAGLVEMSFYQQVPTGAATCKVQSYLGGTQASGAQYNFSNENVWIW